MPSTKIDLTHSRISRLEGLDDLARTLFPNNKNQQRVFLAIFVEVKWAPDQFLAALEPIADQYGFSRRTLETVRAKMRRMGLLDHVSRFNRKTGYREGWVFSRRFEHNLEHLSHHVAMQRASRGPTQKRKDRDAHRYL